MSQDRPRKPVPPSTRAIIGLMRATDGVRRTLVRTLEPFGLTLQQFNVLVILWNEEPLPTLDVAARLVEQTPGITRLLTTLTAKRYITRSASKEDGRQLLCRLTPAGRRLIDEVRPRIGPVHRSLLGAFSDGEITQLIDLLERLPQALAHGERDAG